MAVELIIRENGQSSLLCNPPGVEHVFLQGVAIDALNFLVNNGVITITPTEKPGVMVVEAASGARTEQTRAIGCQSSIIPGRFDGGDLALNEPDPQWMPVNPADN